MTTPNTSPSTTESNPRSAQQLVQDFVSALERLDYDAAIALVGDDVRWVNYPWTTSRNKRQFDKALRGMFAEATRFEVQYADIHERGDGVVYTDRVDIFEGNGLSMTLPVKGEFRVRDGKGVEWVDRFSWTRLALELGKSLPSMAKARLGIEPVEHQPADREHPVPVLRQVGDAALGHIEDHSANPEFGGHGHGAP